jgi:acetyl-CoA carboxylase carboxyl transferase subunit alpha
LVEIEERIAALKEDSEEPDERRRARIAELETKAAELKGQIFSGLSSWDKVQLARHPRRPYTLDYFNIICDEFVELHGDRLSGDDGAVVGGLATIGGSPVVIFGHQKGRTTKERQRRNFGSAHPEGYRKALRLMRLGEKFRWPVISFVDTPAAACLEEAEERGISQAIAFNMKEAFRIRTPIVVIIVGEGGSGGAIGMAVGDRIIMLEYAIYSVIPPESCASIIWRDSALAPQAAEALKLTSDDVLRLGIVDKVIPEPLGGAHRECYETAQRIKKELLAALEELKGLSIEELLRLRYQKFREMGDFLDPAQVPAQKGKSKPGR